MAEKENIIFAFDLDGTIANYGESVEPIVADRLNKLGHIHIITGGTGEAAKKAARLITNKTIHGMRDWTGNHHLDLSDVFGVPKGTFAKSSVFQRYRVNLCRALRRNFHPYIYVGGRSTIDIMPIANKGKIVQRLQKDGKKVIYFYDCKWSMNDEVNNDVPAISVAWKSIRTSHSTVVADINACMKTLI